LKVAFSIFISHPFTAVTFVSSIMIYWIMERIFSRRHFPESLWFGMIEIFVFISSCSKIVFNKKRVTLRIDSVASSGGQRKLTCSVRTLPSAWNRTVNFNVCFLFTRARKPLYLFYKC
jgi:hypothetical protein